MTFFRRIDVHLIVVVLLALFVVAPLTRPGFPLTAAGFRPMWNLHALAQDGGWPAVAEARDFVRGDGLLPRYIALAFHALGADSRDAIKWSLALAYWIGGLLMYGWLRGRWGAPAAMLAAAVYTFLPYRLAITYIAGGLGEPWAMALYPAVGWALCSFSERLTPARGIRACIAWLLLASCNVGLAVWFALVAGLALLALGRAPKALLPLAPALPLLLWSLATAPAGRFSEHYLYVFQLFSASWNALPSGSHWIAEMPFQLGVAPLGLAGLALALGGLGENASSRRPLLVLSIGIVLAVFLSLGVSALFWRASHFDRLLTYPWQMLGFAGLGLALLAGAIPRLWKPLGELPWLAGLIVLTLVSVYGYLSLAWTEWKPRESPVAVFGQNEIALVDYQILGQVYPGADVEIYLHWQCLQPLERDYTVTVQALDKEQRIRGQQDTQPRRGESPTSSWVPGQLISDTYTLTIDPAGPPAGYHIIVALYDAQTGQRLPVGEDDKAVLWENAGIASAWPARLRQESPS